MGVDEAGREHTTPSAVFRVAVGDCHRDVELSSVVQSAGDEGLSGCYLSWSSIGKTDDRRSREGNITKGNHSVSTLTG